MRENARKFVRAKISTNKVYQFYLAYRSHYEHDFAILLGVGGRIIVWIWKNLLGVVMYWIQNLVCNPLRNTNKLPIFMYTFSNFLGIWISSFHVYALIAILFVFLADGGFLTGSNQSGRKFQLYVSNFLTFIIHFAMFSRKKLSRFHFWIKFNGNFVGTSRKIL